MNEEQKELIESLKDRLENINASLSLQISDKIHVQALREIFPQLIEDINHIIKKDYK